MNVTFLIPTRNGLEYFKIAYNSICKNSGNHDIKIIVLDDNSDKDETWEYIKEISEIDGRIKSFKNFGNRQGISGGYKFLSKYVTTEYICHWHNDMYLTAGTLDGVESTFKRFKNCVISLTRIEPNIGYKPGLEKIIWENGPLTFREWDEELFLEKLKEFKSTWNNVYTAGHFAPFFMKTSDYNNIGGVDDIIFPLQSREDSDFAFRLKLYGLQTIQIPEFVFHFASRGNRRNEYETNVMLDNPNWIRHNYHATRNFIRKWHTMAMHDEVLNPFTPVRFITKYTFYNCYDIRDITMLEPYADYIQFYDLPNESVQISSYISEHQSHTIFNLKKKFRHCDFCNLDIVIDLDRYTNDMLEFIDSIQWYIHEVCTKFAGESYEEEFYSGIIKLKVNSMDSIERYMIDANNTEWLLDI